VLACYELTVDDLLVAERRVHDLRKLARHSQEGSVIVIGVADRAALELAPQSLGKDLAGKIALFGVEAAIPKLEGRLVDWGPETAVRYPPSR
jgi:hypothetical protein